MSVKVSSKYQVVIPETVRAALNLKPGTQVEVIAKGGIAYLIPVKSLSSVREAIAPYFTDQDRRDYRDKKDRKF